MGGQRKERKRRNLRKQKARKASKSFQVNENTIEVAEKIDVTHEQVPAKNAREKAFLS